MLRNSHYTTVASVLTDGIEPPSPAYQTGVITGIRRERIAPVGNFEIPSMVLEASILPLNYTGMKVSLPRQGSNLRPIG